MKTEVSTLGLVQNRTARIEPYTKLMVWAQATLLWGRQYYFKVFF